MKKAILATKVGMTQVFSDKGILIPVTVLEAGPCVVVQKKTVEKDGYEAVQVGFKEAKQKNVNKPLTGHYLATKQTPRRVLKEFRLEDISAYEIGSEIKADIFAAGERIDASGVSKGKGYQGTVKRYGMGRGPMSHGSKYHRGVGGLSAGTSPGRVLKGRKLPGQMGNANVTVQNIEVVRVDAEKNLILLKGAVPGPRGAVVFIKDSVKR